MSAVFNNELELELELELNKLDSDRLKAVFWLKMGIGTFVLLSLLTVISGSDGLGISVAMTIVLSPIYILFNTHWGEYKLRYKEYLVPRLTASINDSFNYDPHKIISDDELEKSKLFSTPYTYFNRGGYFSGSIGHIPVEFSEMQTISSASGHSNVTIIKAVFSGVFFNVDVNEFFESSVFVCPNVCKLDRNFGLPDKINDEYLRACVSLEYPGFAEEFNVYCNDKNAIRNLFSVAVMQRLVHIRRSLGSDIRLAFVGSNIMITVSREKSYSEPKLFKSAISFEQASELHMVINDNIKLVTELVEGFSLRGQSSESL